MLKQTLESYGHTCLTFSEGSQALTALASAKFDVLLTDIAMPGMRGLELTREMKRLRPEMIVIVMTGFVGDFSYDQAIEAGASDFIKKPFTIQELLMRIRHVKLQERLRVISITDELTGLLNRRGFFALAHQQIKVFNRVKGSMNMMLLFLDVDNFKAINDTWGHQKGDDALIALSDIFRDTFRESDIVARMSGDEFAVLLIDTPEKNGSPVRNRLQKNLEAYNETSGAPYRLSISAGMAVCDPQKQCSIDVLLRDADALMYEEKTRKKAAGQ